MKRSYTEEDVQCALEDIANRKSVRRASLDWSPPRGTLEGKIKGHVSRSEAFPDPGATFNRLGFSPGKLRAKPYAYTDPSFAGRILAGRHDGLPLGKKWMAGFLRRNPVLKTKK